MVSWDVIRFFFHLSVLLRISNATGSVVRNTGWNLLGVDVLEKAPFVAQNVPIRIKRLEKAISTKKFSGQCVAVEFLFGVNRFCIYSLGQSSLDFSWQEP